MPEQAGSAIGEGDDDAVREVAEAGGVSAFLAAGGEAFAVKEVVDFGSAEFARRIAGAKIGALPQDEEGLELGAAALGAWPVAGSEGGRFVEKEEVGVVASTKELLAASLELEEAGDPALHLPLPEAEVAGVVVDCPPVAKKEATLRGRDDFAEGSDSIA